MWSMWNVLRWMDRVTSHQSVDLDGDTPGSGTCVLYVWARVVFVCVGAVESAVGVSRASLSSLSLDQ